MQSLLENLHNLKHHCMDICLYQSMDGERTGLSRRSSHKDERILKTKWSSREIIYNPLDWWIKAVEECGWYDFAAMTKFLLNVLTHPQPSLDWSWGATLKRMTWNCPGVGDFTYSKPFELMQVMRRPPFRGFLIMSYWPQKHTRWRDYTLCLALQHSGVHQEEPKSATAAKKVWPWPPVWDN